MIILGSSKELSVAVADPPALIHLLFSCLICSNLQLINSACQDGERDIESENATCVAVTVFRKV